MSILSERPAVAKLPITALGPHFGAEIHRTDLGSLDDDQVLALREALVSYKVLFVRGRNHLDDAAQIEFGRRLGEVTVGHPVHDSGDVAPEVYSLDSQDNGFADKQFAQWWGDHRVAARTVGTKTLNHPVVGELVLDWDTLTANTDPDQHLTVWTAEPGSPTHERLRILASWAAGQNLPASPPLT
ncbi:Taurine catabolism dioxygenase TauD, TfdA family [Streptomyces sp. cf386]|uniref:MmyB family transcriptional regulator n=1 Tax=Streptomyces sp. cf386 TaxID=1761904 RepID=UPI000883209F|nr:Taurine catabolism dioxygenase TauD, TfdA family [Streptomyces sp. cf386]